MTKKTYTVYVTFINDEVKKFKGVYKGSFCRKDCFLRFENKDGEEIYICTDQMQMFSMIED